MTILQSPDRVAPTVAQQMFVIGSGIAGGLSGIMIAREFAKVRDVSAPLAIWTTVISVIFTMGAGLYLAKKAAEG
jgi:hypothetical protein